VSSSSSTRRRPALFFHHPSCPTPPSPDCFATLRFRLPLPLTRRLRLILPPACHLRHILPPARRPHPPRAQDGMSPPSDSRICSGASRYALVTTASCSWRLQRQSTTSCTWRPRRWWRRAPRPTQVEEAAGSQPSRSEDLLRPTGPGIPSGRGAPPSARERTATTAGEDDGENGSSSPPTGPGRPSGRGPPPSARERMAASRDSDGRRRWPGRTMGRTDLISDNRDLNRKDYTI
jgi:hypothetical protein